MSKYVLIEIIKIVVHLLPIDINIILKVFKHIYKYWNIIVIVFFSCKMYYNIFIRKNV